MNKNLFRVLGGTLFLTVLIFIIILFYDNHLHRQEDLESPSLISSYWEMGYYKIDPKTILAFLEIGDTNVFTPLLEDPQDVEELTNITIRWTQADFLKITSALGQFLWDDPMELSDWKIYYIYLEGSCGEPIGFNFASITYFKAEGKTYATRLIEVDPYFGWVRWGNGETYPQPILQKWNSVNLLGAKITADDALRIASEDARDRFQVNDACGVLMSSPQSNDFENWHLKIFPGSLDYISYIVNFETGDYTFHQLDN